MHNGHVVYPRTKKAFDAHICTHISQGFSAPDRTKISAPACTLTKGQWISQQNC